MLYRNGHGGGARAVMNDDDDDDHDDFVSCEFTGAAETTRTPATGDKSIPRARSA